MKDPAFGPLASRRLRFALRVGSPQSINMECLKLSVESNEFHERAPNSVAEPVKVGDLSAYFDSLGSGEVMVVSCFLASSSDPEVSAICGGRPPSGKLLATIVDEAPGRERTWWAFVEK